MSKRKRHKILKQTIDKMYERICRKYGVDPKEMLSNYPKITFNGSTSR